MPAVNQWLAAQCPGIFVEPWKVALIAQLIADARRGPRGRQGCVEPAGWLWGNLYDLLHIRRAICWKICNFSDINIIERVKWRKVIADFPWLSPEVREKCWKSGKQVITWLSATLHTCQVCILYLYANSHHSCFMTISISILSLKAP